MNIHQKTSSEDSNQPSKDILITPEVIQSLLERAAEYGGIVLIPLPVTLLSQKSRALFRNKAHFLQGNVDKVFEQIMAEKKSKTPDFEVVSSLLEILKVKITKSNCYLYGMNDSLKCQSGTDKRVARNIARALNGENRVLFLDTDLPFNEIDNHFRDIKDLTVMKSKTIRDSFDNFDNISIEYYDNELTTSPITSSANRLTNHPEYYARLDKEIKILKNIDSIKDKLKTVEAIDWSGGSSEIKKQGEYKIIAKKVVERVFIRVEQIITPHLTQHQISLLKQIANDDLQENIIVGVIEKDWGIKTAEIKARELILENLVIHSCEPYSAKLDPNSDGNGPLLHFFQHFKLWFIKFKLPNSALKTISSSLRKKITRNNISLKELN